MSTHISILIIEDNLQDFLILKEYISRAESFNVKIHHATNLEETRLLALKESFDLVFLDLFLPDSYGKETFIWVSSCVSDVPIIVLSGLVDKSIALNIVQMGAQDYIVKGEFDEMLIEKSIIYSIERHKNEKSLKESERRYRLTFQNAGVAIAEYDGKGLFDFIEELKLKGETKSYFDSYSLEQTDAFRDKIKVTSVNPEVLKLFGFKDIKDFRQNRKKIVTQQSISLYGDLAKSIWDKKRHFKTINEYQTLDDRKVVLLSRFTLYDYENQTVKIVRSGTDITALKEKEKQVETQHMLAEKLSEASLALLKSGNSNKLLDSSFNILGSALKLDKITLIRLEKIEENIFLRPEHLWSSSEFFESSVEDDGFYDKPLSEIPFVSRLKNLEYGEILKFSVDPASEPKDNFNEFLEKKNVKSLLLAPIMQKSGLWAAVIYSSKIKSKEWSEEEILIVKSYGNALGSFMIKTKAERELQELNEQLENRIDQRTEQLTEAVEELESFSYSVSHDLRAPLRTVAGFSQILDKEFSKSLPERAVHLLNNIKNGATEMTHLIHDLLEFSRLGRQSVSFNLIKMNNLCADIIEKLALENPDPRMNFKVPQLISSSGDITLIKHVLQNLIWNAVKFSSKNDFIRIELSSYEENGFVYYSVKDNGIGIDMNYADKVFSVFQRLHTKEEYEGTGVGLAIVKRIIKKHGGTVSVYGELNKGCTFTFSLPKTEMDFKRLNPSPKESHIDLIE